LGALRALGRIRRDPSDPRAVAELCEALDGPFFEMAFRRFRATRVGRRVLDEERDLLSLVADRGWLGSLPDGSLGHACARFVDREGSFRPEPGPAVGRDADGGWDSWQERERRRFSERLDDQRDLEHVVTGYGRDTAGSNALLAFGLGQQPRPGALLAVAWACLRAGREQRRVLFAAFGRGRRAAWLPATDWESLLALPLHDVRSLLGLGVPPPSLGGRSPGKPVAA